MACGLRLLPRQYLLWMMMDHNIPDNFGGLESEYSSYSRSEICILPVPFDLTSSWRKGSDKGPQAIINSSHYVELYDIETDFEVYQHGIHTLESIQARNSRQMIDKVKQKIQSLLRDNKFVVTLGGEHTVSLGVIEAHLKHYSQLSILHLDAHTDLRNSYEGNGYSHACVMARVREYTDKVISVGIRSMDKSEMSKIIPENLFSAHYISEHPNWHDQVITRLDENVYLSLDIDVFDPSVIPSTGTPEPGGLDWFQIVKLLKKVVEKKNLVGFDVVELCPHPEHPASDFTAAKLIYKLLSYIFSKQRYSQ